MKFDAPLTFAPLYKERVWGGRRMQVELGRSLPPDVPIGESWEIVDREDAQSVVNAGPHKGLTLHDLWTLHRSDVFGTEVPDSPRFPLLAKVLDARDTLSVQVHPPADVASSLGGEPKTEMWYALGYSPDAAVYAGLRAGTTKEEFVAAIQHGGVEKLLHRIPFKARDTIFIPSGRCHAIGAGCLIVEIQQNSDTTYRVFDWDRVGLDGKPRELHVPESLASIDFSDHEPSLALKNKEPLVACDHFTTDEWTLSSPREDDYSGAALFTVTEGSMRIGPTVFHRGDFLLLPAEATDRLLVPLTLKACVLRSVIGEGKHSSKKKP